VKKKRREWKVEDNNANHTLDFTRKVGGKNKGAHVDTIAMWLKSMKLLIFELCNS
jgi:hypothetical protein